ncbi:hypothetical protein OK016_21875 [Vibrio chagasii]|nr:hypothetical protein [Vibrio chagasii]
MAAILMMHSRMWLAAQLCRDWRKRRVVVRQFLVLELKPWVVKAMKLPDGEVQR